MENRMEMVPEQEEEKRVIKTGRRHFSRLGLSFFFGTLIIYAVQIGVAVFAQKLFPQALKNGNVSMVLGMLPMYLIGMPLMILLISRVPAKHIAPKKMSAGQMAIAALMAYCIMYCSNLVGVGINAALEVIKGSAIQNTITEVVTGTDAWVMVLFGVICAPVYEELIFRKLLIDRAVQYGEGTAILLSGLLFGLFHGNLSQFIYAAALGMFLAFLYVKTGKIRYTVILHMIVNFIGSVLGKWVLEKSGYMELLSDLSVLETNPGAVIGGMLILLAYVFCLIGIVIAGFVLLIVFRKRFRVSKGEAVLPAGKRFLTVICNPGMLLFVLFWIGIIVQQLLA